MRHAKAVLFVTHDKGKIGDHDVRLQNCVRATHDIYLACGYARLHLLLFLRRHTTSQVPHLFVGEISLQKGVVLLRQHLRRGQVRRTITAVDRHKNPTQRHRRLTATDVPLHKPIHHDGRAKILVDFVNRLLLPVRKLEGKARRELLNRRRRRCIFMHSYVLFSALYQLESGEEDEIFLQGDTLCADGDLVESFRRVNLIERRGQRGKVVLLLNRKREDGLPFDKAQRLAHRTPHHLLRESSRKRIHGDNPLQVPRPIERLEGGIDQSDLPELILHPSVE